MARDIDERDLLDVLPPLGDLSGEEELLAPEDLGVGFDGDGDERVGLDDSTGLEDAGALFVLDLPPREATDDAEVDVIPLAEGVGGEDEYGWTEDAGSAEEERWDPGELEVPSMTPLGRDDDGEECVEEVFELGGGGDDAIPHLPPLDADLDADDDEGIELSMELPSIDSHVELPPALDSAMVRLEHEGPVYDVVLGQPRWVLGDGLDVGAERRCNASAWEGTPTSLSVDGEVVLVGTERGAHRSTDGGRTFTRVEGLEGVVRFTAEREGPIWACSDSHGLRKSEDGGVTWSHPLLLTTVVALASIGKGVVALCAPAEAAPQLARSEDAGQRWAALDVPDLPRAEHGKTRFSVAVFGDYVVVASDGDSGGPFLSNDGGRRWLRLPGLPPACALALRREDGLAVYSAHAAAGRSAVVRHPPNGGEAGVVLACAGTIHRLVFGDEDDLWVATDEGLYRVHMERER